MRTQLKPIATQDCPGGLGVKVIFEVHQGHDLAVDIPQEHAVAVHAEFLGRSRGPGLFDLWSAGNLLDGQYTEVIVALVDERARFSLVFVSDGPQWQTPVEPVDAILTGFHLNLPFFMAEAPALNGSQSS